MICIWHIIFRNLDLYRSRRMENRFQEWKDFLKATTTGTAIFFISGTILDIQTFSPIFYFTLWFSTTILTLSFRIFLRYILRKIRLNNRNLRFVTIVGTNQRAYDIERWISSGRINADYMKKYVLQVFFNDADSLRGRKNGNSNCR